MGLYRRRRQRSVGGFEIYDAFLQIAKVVYTGLAPVSAERQSSSQR